MVINEKALKAIPTGEIKKLYRSVFLDAVEEVATLNSPMQSYKIAIKCEKELKRRVKTK